MWGPLHGLSWSLHEGMLHEFFFKDPLTLATWGLVAVTLLLVIDSWRKGKEQRKRWDREDQQHKQDREEERARWVAEDKKQQELQSLRYRFGVMPAKEGGVAVWLANMGQTAILWRSLWIERGDPTALEQFDLRPIWLEQMKIVTAGGLTEFKIPNDLYLSRPDLNSSNKAQFSMEVRCWLSLEGLENQIVTPKKRFTAIVDPQKGLIATSRGFERDGIEP